MMRKPNILNFSTKLFENASQASDKICFNISFPICWKSSDSAMTISTRISLIYTILFMTKYKKIYTSKDSLIIIIFTAVSIFKKNRLELCVSNIFDTAALDNLVKGQATLRLDLTRLEWSRP